MRLIKGKTFYNKPWYNSYRSMMSRCYREKDASYKSYGGRGIKVCDEWHNIENFEAWVKDNPYYDGATIDRINTNGNYEPSNCKWSTRIEQCNNRRNNVIVEHNGERHTLSEWADIIGINKSTIKNRYWRGDRGERLLEKRRYKCHG